MKINLKIKIQKLLITFKVFKICNKLKKRVTRIKNLPIKWNHLFNYQAIKLITTMITKKGNLIVHINKKIQ